MAPRCLSKLFHRPRFRHFAAHHASPNPVATATPAARKTHWVGCACALCCGTGDGHGLMFPMPSASALTRNSARSARTVVCSPGTTYPGSPAVRVPLGEYDLAGCARQQRCAQPGSDAPRPGQQTPQATRPGSNFSATSGRTTAWPPHRHPSRPTRQASRPKTTRPRCVHAGG